MPRPQRGRSLEVVIAGWSRRVGTTRSGHETRLHAAGRELSISVEAEGLHDIPAAIRACSALLDALAVTLVVDCPTVTRRQEFRRRPASRRMKRGD